MFHDSLIPKIKLTVITLLLMGGYSTSLVAQTGQVNAVPGSIQNATSNAGRNTPAPWRPSFGSLAKQNGTNNSNLTIPGRQSFPNATGGLPAPNSPITNSAGINLQTGTNNLPVARTTVTQSNSVTTQTSNVPIQHPSSSLPSATSPASASNRNLPLSQTQQGIATSASQSPFAEPQDRPLPRGTITRVTKAMKQLPNDAGQVWREYDISPYTSQITGVVDPQQAILDWILKETGMEMWFNQPLGILSADKNQVRVYHTPEIQERVHRIIDRFVNTKGQVQNLQVSLVTVGKPNWRSTAYPVLQPIEVQSPGVEAWMITKENAALLRASLARRGDFKDHGTGRIGQNDGQTVVMRNTRPVQFIRNFRWTGNPLTPYQPLVTTIDEGYTLEISSLTSLDGETIEATIECHVDQVEKLNTVKVDVPGSVGATTDKISLQIPRLVSWRLKERFRWQNDQVLLLSCGVVATPGPQTNSPVNIPGILGGNRQRADALLFVDYRGPELENGAIGASARNRTIPVNPRR